MGEDRQTIHIAVEDREGVDLSEYLDAGADFIKGGVTDGTCLVHCVSGVSRSVTFLIAYLIKHCEMNYDDALNLVQEKKGFLLAEPNPDFQTQLQSFELKQNSE